MTDWDRKKEGGFTPPLNLIGLALRNASNSRAGFIALTSVIIIMLVLLVIVFSLSQTSFLARFNILDSEAKEKSLGLAEACADIAVLKLANNPAYAGGEDFTVEGDVCRIDSVADSGANKLIKTTATYNSAVTNMEIILDPANDYSTVSWQEVANL